MRSVVIMAMWREGSSTPSSRRVATARLTALPDSPRLRGLCHRETVKTPPSARRPRKTFQA